MRFNLLLLPIEAQVIYIQQLDIQELVLMYKLNHAYRNLLDSKYILELIADKFNLQEYNTFYDLVVDYIFRLTPYQIYLLYLTYPYLRYYIRDITTLN